MQFTLLNVMLGLRMYVFFISAFKVALSRVAVQPNMTSNPAIASLLQSRRRVGRVAELVRQQSAHQNEHARQQG